MKLHGGHWLLLGGVVVLAMLLHANRNCASCGAKHAAMTGASGAWPGVGPGVASTPGYSGQQNA